MSLTRQSPAPRCQLHCGIKLRGVSYNAESSSGVSLILQSPAPRCQSHCFRAKLRGVRGVSYIVSEPSSEVSVTLRSQAQRSASTCSGSAALYREHCYTLIGTGEPKIPTYDSNVSMKSYQYHKML